MQQKSKFKIGDRVVAVADFRPVRKGMIGTVVGFSTLAGNPLVDFGPGHDGHGHCRPARKHKKTCWYPHNGILRLANDHVPAMAPMTKDIFNHLLDKGSITNVEAQAIYKCRALPRRIADLKEMGVSIRREWRKDKTGQRYVRYFFVKAPHELVVRYHW